MPAPHDGFLRANRLFWETVTPAHVNSAHYSEKRERLLAGRSVLDAKILELLGSLRGESVLQPYCHLGYDVLSLHRLGAEHIAGFDQDPHAIAVASRVAEQLELASARFMVSEPGTVPILDRKFDVILVTFGTICWIPEIQPWFAALARLTSPGGRIVIAELHPLLFSFDFLQASVPVHPLTSPLDRPITIRRHGSYAVPDDPRPTVSYNWNHSLGDVVTALRSVGFLVDRLGEYNSLPEGNGYPNLTPDSEGRWTPTPPLCEFPLMFTVNATFHGI